MKILLTVDPEIPVPPIAYGGIERIVDALITGLVKEGHEVTLCAHRDSKVPCKLVPWKGRRSQNRKDSIKNMLTVTGLILLNKYDVVHSFSRLAYMTLIMPFGIRKIMTYQREPTLSQIKKAVQLSKKGSMVFTGCSNYISDQIKTVAEAHTVYNCAPVDKYTGTTEVAADAPLVFLGRIEPIKGTHNAIAIAKKSGKKLIIAGNIPAGYQSYFDQNITPFLNEDITYTGPVNDEQKNEMLGKALAFLMPIEWNEPFGIVMAEAMACGTPVIGFPRGAVKEVVEEGINGFLCDNADEAAARVPSAGMLSRTTIRKIAEKKYSDVKMVSNYLALYKKGLTGF